MSKVTVSKTVLEAFHALKNKVVPPGEGVQGNPLVSQVVAEMFDKAPAGLEVELLSFSLTTEPTAKVRMVGEQKNIPQPTGEFQLRGLAEIRVGQETTSVMMHAHTAAAFAGGDKQTLIGRTGDITNGRNQGKKWLSLTPANGFPSADDVEKFLAANVGTTTTTAKQTPAPAAP